jgi:hypothetical protein
MCDYHISCEMHIFVTLILGIKVKSLGQIFYTFLFGSYVKPLLYFLCGLLYGLKVSQLMYNIFPCERNISDVIHDEGK